MKKKTNIKNWEIGDSFVKKIESDKYPDYNDKYLIVICSGYYQYSKFNDKSIYPTVYLKISSKKIQTTEDINDAEFIIYNKIHWSWRYLPYSGLISDAELEAIRDKTELFPDDYYYLNEYQVDIFPSRENKTFIENSQYFQFPEFKKPLDEYFHWRDGLTTNFQGTFFSSWKIDLMIRAYRRNNLRKWAFYQLPREEMVKCKDSLKPIYDKYYEDFIESYNMDEH